MNTQILQKAVTRLADQIKVKANWEPYDEEIDGRVFLYLDDNPVVLYVETKQELRKQQIPKLAQLAKNYKPLVVVAENIFPTLKQELKQKGIGYIDTAGNAHIRYKNVYIHLEGRKTEEPQPVKNRAFTKKGLQVVFYFLNEEGAINRPYRTIAADTGVALGNIPQIIEALKQTGFILAIDEKNIQLKNRKQLLDRWIAGYRETLKPALHIGDFTFWHREHEAAWEKIDLDTTQTVWGGEPAAALLTKYLRPEILTLYTDEYKTNIANRLKLLPLEVGPVKIYEKFWKQPQLTAAPPLLVYADLLITEDPRCVETAHLIYEKYLKDVIEKY